MAHGTADTTTSYHAGARGRADERITVSCTIGRPVGSCSRPTTVRFLVTPGAMATKAGAEFELIEQASTSELATRSKRATDGFASARSG